MPKLEDLQRGAQVRGILPNAAVTVVDVQWHGSNVIELTYKDDQGRLASELLYRDRESQLSIEHPGRIWSFDADSESFRLVSEAYRIHLAHLFDPLLADDPGAGKTIMAGLLIKELIVRGDLHHCLVCCPGNRRSAGGTPGTPTGATRTRTRRVHAAEGA